MNSWKRQVHTFVLSPGRSESTSVFSWDNRTMGRISYLVWARSTSPSYPADTKFRGTFLKTSETRRIARTLQRNPVISSARSWNRNNEVVTNSLSLFLTGNARGSISIPCSNGSRILGLGAEALGLHHRLVVLSVRRLFARVLLVMNSNGSKEGIRKLWSLPA